MPWGEFEKSKGYFSSLNLTQMELYPHNQKAYESIVKMFGTGNLACAIQPCGTGKSMLIAQTIIDNPDNTHLLLAPGEHIRREIQKHLNGRKILFSTYAGLKSSDLMLFRDAFDFIYADEIHRLGADDWGPAFLKLLELCPKAKVLGTTATPIRYLDGHRNMANEIFNGRIASEMSLASALAQGILPRPMYRKAIYNCSEQLESGSKAKQKVNQDLSASMMDWENSEGVGDMIKRNLGPERRRVIVFCKNLEHMLMMRQKLEPVFESIYGVVECVAIHSKFKASKNARAMDNFAREDDRAVILFTVDMVNEGLHSKYCNTVILLRDTQSPILFFQQFGRALSADGIHQPLIIDVVNNFRMLEQLEQDVIREMELDISTKSRGEGNKMKLPFEIVDEVLDIESMLPASGEKSQYKLPPVTINGVSIHDGKDMERPKIKACIDRLVAHFTQNGLDDIGEATRKDVTFIQSLRRGGLFPGERERLQTAGVPFEISPCEGGWLDMAKRVIKFDEENHRLPGYGDDPDLYSFWLREDVNRGLEHCFEKFFKVNIEADRIRERLHLIILEKRGRPRRERRKKSKV